MDIITIIVAAGSGQRMQAGKNKILLDLGGKTVLNRTIELWLPFSQQLILVINPHDEAAIKELIAGYNPQPYLVYGGASRAQSVRNALNCLPNPIDKNPQYIAIHDGARPLTHSDDILAVIKAAKAHQAAILAAPVSDTIRYRNKQFCGNLVPREQLLAAQTPQIFERQLLVKAYQQVEDLNLFTDDAAIVQAANHDCAYILAKHNNLKLTEPKDLALACALWQKGVKE